MEDAVEKTGDAYQASSLGRTTSRYEVRIVSLLQQPGSNDVMINKSILTDPHQRLQQPLIGVLNINLAEPVVIIGVLMLWCCAIFAFLHKWRSLRILEPAEPRYKHAPQNLEQIKIVKRHRDSVIYKSYSENMSRTMIARQARLDRMNLMPRIQLCSDSGIESSLTVYHCKTDAFSAIKGLAASCTNIMATVHSDVVGPLPYAQSGSDEFVETCV